MRAYHFLRAKWARVDLKHLRLKVSTFADLNDPFELAAGNLSDKKLRRRFKKSMRTILDTYGVLCFSRNWRNPVLWSHYADKHHGVCLGFDLLLNTAKDVEYVKTRFLFDESDLQNGGPTDTQRNRLFFTKFQHWKYEDEVRVILRLQDAVKDGCHYFQPFNAQLKLKEIIAGPRCSLTRAQLLDSLGDGATNVAITKARLAFQTFSVVKDQRGFTARRGRRTT